MNTTVIAALVEALEWAAPLAIRQAYSIAPQTGSGALDAAVEIAARQSSIDIALANARAALTPVPVLYFVIGPGVWGKGATLAEARRNARKHASKGARLLGYSTTDSEAYITDTGSLCWRKPHTMTELGAV